jgi:lambda repressor-like predicted transcriptional regulator
MNQQGELDKVRVIEQVVATTTLDPYLSLKALAKYSGLSERTLRTCIADPESPLPCYRPAGRVLVRVSEYDAWAKRFRSLGRPDLQSIVDEIVNAITEKPQRAA